VAAPDRVSSEEHDALHPPVIPAFWIPRGGKRMQGMTSQIGWEGFRIVTGGEGGWKVVKDGDFTIYICEDGYCEIPATPKNKAKFEGLSKPMPVYAMQMEAGQDGEGNEIQVPARDPETGKPLYTDKLLRTEPPAFRRAAALRTFDPKKSEVDYIRPWLRQFVQVPGAIMEPVEG
jgi:hypothetical protein